MGAKGWQVVERAVAARQARAKAKAVKSTHSTETVASMVSALSRLLAVAVLSGCERYLAKSVCKQRLRGFESLWGRVVGGVIKVTEQAKLPRQAM